MENETGQTAFYIKQDIREEGENPKHKEPFKDLVQEVRYIERLVTYLQEIIEEVRGMSDPSIDDFARIASKSDGLVLHIKKINFYGRSVGSVKQSLEDYLEYMKLPKEDREREPHRDSRGFFLDSRLQTEFDQEFLKEPKERILHDVDPQVLGELNRRLEREKGGAARGMSMKDVKEGLAEVTSESNKKFDQFVAKELAV
ncbi:hypothetical protein C0581_03775 [Candidatus Parcubacteria bacterium]|nr:MAG: hypothetical protein C0581_03775 [Candidatus Parcubacteria bacterium]